jgi:hypothetical protein
VRVEFDFSHLGQTTWHEYAMRFLTGGLITAAAGIIAKEFGPGVGGLFLAYPAIFPASATLIEKHETEKKHEKGLHGTRRAREIASVDAAGSAMGSVGLLAFAVVVWQLIPDRSPWLIIAAATVIWLIVSVLIWWIRKHGHRIITWFAKPTRRAPRAL